MITIALMILALLAILATSMAAISPNLRDAALSAARDLPAAAGAVTSTAIDLGINSGWGARTGQCEFMITAPALNTTQLPDNKTATYDVMASASSDMSNPILMMGSVIIQTGAAAAGAAAATYRFRVASDCLQYIAVRSTTSAASGDCSAASMKLEALF